MELVKLSTKGTDKYSYTCSTGNVSQLLHAAAPLRHMSVSGAVLGTGKAGSAQGGTFS